MIAAYGYFCMKANQLVRRYFVLFIALSLAGFGVALTTKAEIGISSLASTAYVISVYFPVTMGVMLIVFNVLSLVLQPPLMSKEERKAQFVNMMLQIPALFAFGLFVDFFMWVMQDFNPSDFGYIVCLAIFILGSVITAINIILQAIADVAKIACDAFVIVLAKRFNFNLGRVKLVFDAAFVVAAAIISLICSGFSEIIGIREGTIIGTIIVGPCVTLLSPYFKFVENWIVKGQPSTATSTPVASVSEES